MLNIVIPMAGEGSRFAQAGFVDPKPLIHVNGVSMIELVVGNVAPKQPHRFIFICQAAHVKAYGLEAFLSKIAPQSEIIQLEQKTDGALCSVLAARSLIDQDMPLVIANSDQYIEGGVDGFYDYWSDEDLDGLIMTMSASDPKWSFAARRPDGLVGRVAEKDPISDEATVGIYAFRRGKDFVAAGDRMIERNLRVNGEFYVAPVYNELIDSGARIGAYSIGAVDDRMHGLGTPEDLAAFLAWGHKAQASKERQAS
jgi:NDP-sugar pyrophosphorylase family protein